MRLLRSSFLLAASVPMIAQLSAYGQLQELGSGTPGPVRAQHVTAELISDLPSSQQWSDGREHRPHCSLAGWTRGSRHQGLDFGRWPARRWRCFAAGVTVVAAVAVPLSGFLSDRMQWQPFSNTALEAAENQGKPVFVDFTAAWCLSCQVNEKAMLEDKSVEQELLRRHNVLPRADWTRYDPEITTALDRSAESGVPTYFVFPGITDESAHVLPEFLTRRMVLDAIRRTGS